MLSDLRAQLTKHLEESLKRNLPSGVVLPPVDLDFPAQRLHGEFSANIALKSAKLLRKAPAVIAEEFRGIFQDSLTDTPFQNKIAKIEVKNPGFINFFLTPLALFGILEEIFKAKNDYGRCDCGRGQKVQVEFVSANPTGPLSVAHARQAAVGDALAHILDFLGFKATREYYINDGGNQINLLGESIRCRAIELLGGEASLPENGYQGEYIKDMAREFITKAGIKTLEKLASQDRVNFKNYGVEYLLSVIRKDLEDFNVRFECWTNESKVATKENIAAVLNLLEEKGFLYEKDGALWFKSTHFGDDKDRVVKKSDGSYTYLLPDIVYHKNKYERGFTKIINIWGPDHHGYIPRIKAAVQALGKSPDSLNVLIVQLATIYRDGKPVSMSTRRGEFISLREVIDEVGVDAARFFFLMRHIDAHLDFDLELAKKETPENPVYYIQYAHARIHSINKKAGETGLRQKEKGFSLLKEPEELELIKRLGSFPDSLMICYHELDPYALMSYLHELAMTFHRFYDQHRVIGEDPELSCERLALANATKIVLANGLRLLGLSTPERM
ncbi:MAG: arginine--tRNA ligase [Candidatus Omnitrophica bacterium]|nr:arginine--tRNA ligase [Candidatus Omnitrophota bacterium]